MTIDAHAYNITVRRGEFEGEMLFEARIRELPDLVAYADTAEEAYTLAVDAIETTAEAFAERGRTMPAPSVPADDFSGRVTLRLAKSLHRALAEAADAEGVSLNQHLVNVLSYYAGFATGRRHEGKSLWQAQPAVTPSRAGGRRRSPLHLVDSSPIQQEQAASWN